MKYLFLPFLLSILLLTPSCKQQVAQGADYLLLIDKNNYVDQKGDTIIGHGKYSYCFTDTFRTYAIVMTKEDRYIAIDRNDKMMYVVYNYDNGPDYMSEGLFRIIDPETAGGKIGYADSATGKIVIKAQYECAFPFEKGMAKVALNCQEAQKSDSTKTSAEEGEGHVMMESEHWIYIDRTGKIVEGKTQ